MGIDREESEQVVPFEVLANYLPKQLEARAAMKRYKYLLFGGSKGGGKSRWLRWQLLELLIWAATLGHFRVRAGLFCEDYPQLMDRQIVKIETEFPAWLGELGSDKTNGLRFKLRPQYGAGILALRNLDRPEKYDSSEFAFIGVDELTKNEWEVFSNHLRTILRWPNFDFCRFIAGSNPGGIGHDWVHKLFILNDFSGYDEDEPGQFGFVASGAKDNKYNSREYLRQLNSIVDPRLKAAYRDGNWDVFVGQFFGEWNRDVHVVPHFNPPDFLPRYMELDYGHDAPSAVYWVASDYEKRQIHYRELYGPGMTPRILAIRIVELTMKEEIPRIEGIYCDPSIWSSKAGEQSIAAQIEAVFKELGFPVKLIKAFNDRPAGALKIRELLAPFDDHNGRKTAHLLFTEACPNAIRTIPKLIFDKKNAEVWDEKCEDHSADAVKYGALTRAGNPSNLAAVARRQDANPNLSSANSDW